MVSTVQKLRVFVASPGDVGDERQRLQVVVDELNRTVGNEKHTVLELVRWETHVAPDMGRAQDVVNRQIGEHDIFIGIMWKRFGTPTGCAGSGTEEEFDNAYASWRDTKGPRIMLYFSQAPFMPRSDAEVEQVRKVLAFKQKVQSLALIFEYAGPDGFERLVREHLQTAIRDVLKSAVSAASPHVPRTLTDNAGSSHPSSPVETIHPLAHQITVMRERFFELFEKHHVPLTVVPILLRDFGFSVSAIEDRVRLADLLSEDAITFLADMFHVERAWLRGSTTDVTRVPLRWYKSPDRFCRAVSEADQLGQHVWVHFIRRSKSQPGLFRWFGGYEFSAGVVVEYEHQVCDGVTFSTYERWEEQDWGTWNCRLFYKSLIRFCLQHSLINVRLLMEATDADYAREGPHGGIEIVGDLLTPEVFDALHAGTVFPIDALGARGGGRWEPIDLVSENVGAKDDIDELPFVDKVLADYRAERFLPTGRAHDTNLA